MATRYDYRQNIIEDIENYIAERGIEVYKNEIDDKYNELYDDMFVSDQITGNGSGSYTFSTWQAEENICHNFDLLSEAIKEFGGDAKMLQNAETADVIIRCYLLGECLLEVLESVAIEGEEEEEEE